MGFRMRRKTTLAGFNKIEEACGEMISGARVPAGVTSNVVREISLVIFNC